MFALLTLFGLQLPILSLLSYPPPQIQMVFSAIFIGRDEKEKEKGGGKKQVCYLPVLIVSFQNNALSCFLFEETVAQGNEVTYPRSHSQ